jgi:hypothetical protein
MSNNKKNNKKEKKSLNELTDSELDGISGGSSFSNNSRVSCVYGVTPEPPAPKISGINDLYIQK